MPTHFTEHPCNFRQSCSQLVAVVPCKGGLPVPCHHMCMQQAGRLAARTGLFATPEATCFASCPHVTTYVSF